METAYNVPMIIYLTLVHASALYGAVCIPQCDWYTLLWALILWPISGLGITAGAHRLWAHRSYKASFPLRSCLMICNTIANQGTIYHWARDHRVHHKYAETDADPHNAKRGFWFSHIGWLFEKKHPSVISGGKRIQYDDLLKDPVVQFQKQLDPWFPLTMCFIFPGAVVTIWGDSFWNGFWVAGALRYTAVLHFTWCVNSLAHIYGDRPYDKDIHATENLLVSVLAIGEGWHNWHHKYPFDYAASEFGVSSQYNPTKLFLDTMGSLGLASDFKRATSVWHKQKKRQITVN
jgi:stearoyl-CoA desaturase (delta-9 desaturase)